jgi:hypothetical protein
VPLFKVRASLLGYPMHTGPTDPYDHPLEFRISGELNGEPIVGFLRSRDRQELQNILERYSSMTRSDVMELAGAVEMGLT